MHILDGTLAVEVIKGARGDFCVGTLKTSIGEFKIKDAALEQFERGSYQGRFTIEKIYIESTRWRGGWFTNLMAKVSEDGYQITDEADTASPTSVAQAEPDPLDDELTSKQAGKPVKVKASSPASIRSVATANPSTDTQSSAESDEKLFGIELHPLFVERSEWIQLDNTIDREQFRLQRERLKEVGYRFRAKNQSWQLEQR